MTFVIIIHIKMPPDTELISVSGGIFYTNQYIHFLEITD